MEAQLESEVIEQKDNQQKDTQQKKTIMAIGIDNRGLVVAKTNSELLRYCGALISSSMVPQQFDEPQKLFGALMFVRSLGLPDTSIRQVAIIHGTPTLWGDLPLALVQSSADFDGIKEYWFDEDYNKICFENKNLTSDVWGAVCLIKRKNNEYESYSFTMDDAEKAELYPPKKRDGSLATSSPWIKYTRIMLRYKARSIALKSQFADKISGVSIAEHDFDVLPNKMTEKELKDVTPRNASEEFKNAINNTIGEK